MDELRPHDPSRIGAYRLLARLGAGGMGQVFLGRSPGGRLVAVKEIRDDLSDHPEALARFRREAATVEAVRSAYTAQLIEASLDTPPYWLVTEYVAGPTLLAAVRAGGPFPPDSALKLFAALAEGLAAVHAHGVTHRDLKPQNVILSPQGPQLIDFGIARGIGQTVLTAAGTAPGTPGFAAPEVVLRNEAGPAADVFALGATLAYTATGRPPFGSGEPATVSYRAVYEDIDLDGVHPPLAALIRECAAKDPADRPSPSAVVARCAVDSALATDAHYLALSRTGAAAARDEETARSPVDATGCGEGEREEAAGGLPPGAGAAHRDAGVARDGGTVSAGPAGSTPYDAPDRPAGAARAGRRGALGLAVVAAALASAAMAWLLSGSPSDRDSGAGGTGGAEVSGRPVSSAPAAGPPDHIVDDGTSRERWALADDPAQAAQGIGSCALSDLDTAALPVELRSSVSHTTGSDTASVELRPKNAGRGDRPEPYHVAVGIRPPHGVDPATGRPGRTTGEGVGFTSEPVDLFSRWSSGGTLTLRYPRDFRAHLGDRTVEAVPVGKDRGDWTVVLYHVEGGPERITPVLCTGFHA
ncbi:serine/threonine-protein kinase [Streptomyces sp. NPDC006296]|uniref:serine/threonine-protein kinase n=1 Tax=Streptomyces sp. NPDC006296 TaxID=3156746 RepID=UPI0033B25F85